MAMKKTELYKQLAHKVDGQRKKELTPQRFSKDSAGEGGQKSSNRLLDQLIKKSRRE